MYEMADRKDADADLLVSGNSNIGIETSMSSNIGGVGVGETSLPYILRYIHTYIHTYIQIYIHTVVTSASCVLT